MSTKFKHLKIVYEICMRPNLSLKNVSMYVLLTFYNHTFEPDTYMIYRAITETLTTEKYVTMISQYTYP